MYHLRGEEPLFTINKCDHEFLDFNSAYIVEPSRLSNLIRSVFDEILYLLRRPSNLISPFVGETVYSLGTPRREYLVMEGVRPSLWEASCSSKFLDRHQP